MRNKLLERRVQLKARVWPFSDLWEQEVYRLWRCQGSHLLSTCSGVLVAAGAIPTHSLHIKPRTQPSSSSEVERKGTGASPPYFSRSGWSTELTDPEGSSTGLATI